MFTSFVASFSSRVCAYEPQQYIGSVAPTQAGGQCSVGEALNAKRGVKGLFVGRRVLDSEPPVGALLPGLLKYVRLGRNQP